MMKSKCILSLFYVLGVGILLFPHSAQALSSQEYMYNASNHLDSVNESNGKHVKFIYDKNGNVVRRIADHNLLRNGDFEVVGDGEVASGWKYWKSEGAVGTYLITQSSISSGQYAQKIDAQKIPSGAMNIYQDVQVTPNQTYSVSGRLLIERMKNADFYVAIHYFDPNYNLVGAETPFTYGTPASWFTFTGELTPPKGAAIARIHFHLQESAENGYGTIYVDALKMIQGAATNLLYNSSFQEIKAKESTSAGWSVWKSEGSEGNVSSVDVAPKQGQSSQFIDARKMPGGGINFYQDIPIVPGVHYDLSADVKIEELNHASLSFALHYFDQHYRLVGADTPAHVNKPIDWTRLQGQFIPPPNATLVRIHFHLSETGTSGKGKVYIANPKLKRV
ncbi:carbohydrate binding domain-containing protein [Paenibacillus alvei]|uniref:carbohydrate binding domain-containing protein n=1 Tax=Paenibacillus alvei TaxID=44250 RepID=UPI0013D9F57A|nr:carbohydrate binding domain-containing protein [Paenibacillus alvei]